MKTEPTIDKSGRAGRTTQIAGMVTTILVAFMWMYFGRLYLIHDPVEWRIVNQQLGYPLYIVPLIGVTHILGGVGSFYRHVADAQRGSGPSLIRSPKSTSRPLTSGQRKLKWREQAKSLIEVGLDDERRIGTGKRPSILRYATSELLEVGRLSVTNLR